MPLDAPHPVAFVTGASSGLGRGLALRLGADGWAVGLAARRVEALEDVCREIQAAGGVAVVCPCDVSDREQVHRAVDRARSSLGPVTLAVANAGISGMTEVDRLDARDVQRMTSINFLGAVYLVEAVLPDMLARGRGQLVAVGSLAGYGGLPKTAAYSATKGALHNFFESLRVDLRDRGVAVTIITPGYVDTPMTELNAHPMPFLQDPGQAVDRMMRAIRARRRLLSFPRPLSTLTWLAQIFPTRVYDFLASRQRRDKKAAAETGPSGP